MKSTAIRIISIGWILSFMMAIVLIGGPNANATKYGAGSYGRCQYQSCAISLSSSNSINVNVIPSSGSTKCSVASDTVTVTTSSSTGYSLTLIDGDTINTLTSSGQSIAASAGTIASPIALTANTWGYRVDNQAGFGAGPTTAISSGANPALSFAGIRPSTDTAERIVNSTVAATNGAATTVWYGVCVNVTQASGTYSDSVLYTAITN